MQKYITLFCEPFVTYWIFPPLLLSIVVSVVHYWVRNKGWLSTSILMSGIHSIWNKNSCILIQGKCCVDASIRLWKTLTNIQSLYLNDAEWAQVCTRCSKSRLKAETGGALDTTWGENKINFNPLRLNKDYLRVSWLKQMQWNVFVHTSWFVKKIMNSFGVNSSCSGERQAAVLWARLQGGSQVLPA